MVLPDRELERDPLGPRTARASKSRILYHGPYIIDCRQHHTLVLLYVSLWWTRPLFQVLPGTEDNGAPDAAPAAAAEAEVDMSMFDLSKKKKKKKKKTKTEGEDEEGGGDGEDREEGEGRYNYETLLERIQV